MPSAERRAVGGACVCRSGRLSALRHEGLRMGDALAGEPVVPASRLVWLGGAVVPPGGDPAHVGEALQDLVDGRSGSAGGADDCPAMQLVISCVEERLHDIEEGSGYPLRLSCHTLSVLGETDLGE